MGTKLSCFTYLVNKVTKSCHKFSFKTANDMAQHMRTSFTAFLANNFEWKAKFYFYISWLYLKLTDVHIFISFSTMLTTLEMENPQQHFESSLVSATLKLRCKYALPFAEKLTIILLVSEVLEVRVSDLRVFQV